MNFVRKKSDRETFVQNLLFTKEMALRAALDLKVKGMSKDEAKVPIEEKTRALLKSVS